MSGFLQIVIPPVLGKLADWSLRSGSFSGPVGDAPVIFPSGMHEVEIIALHRSLQAKGRLVLRVKVWVAENDVTRVRLPFRFPKEN